MISPLGWVKLFNPAASTYFIGNGCQWAWFSVETLTINHNNSFKKSICPVSNTKLIFYLAYILCKTLKQILASTPAIRLSLYNVDLKAYTTKKQLIPSVGDHIAYSPPSGVQTLWRLIILLSCIYTNKQNFTAPTSHKTRTLCWYFMSAKGKLSQLGKEMKSLLSLGHIPM